MIEVPLSDLNAWYEEHVCRTTTLEIVRCLFQGNFPDAPVSQVSELGTYEYLFEEYREGLGEAEFQIYLQCQMAAFKAYHPETAFYPGYCFAKGAEDRYAEGQERIRHAGYYSFRSEIYRVSFPNECDALGAYFRRWLIWDGKDEEEEPNWPEVRASFAPRSHPFWVTLSCTCAQAQARGKEFYAIWISGKKRLLARQLMQDRNEYERACIDALIFTAGQISPRSSEFIVLPEEKASFAYQVAIQFYDIRKEILSPSPSLSISVGGNAS